jgi:DinB superfamily
MTERDLLVAGLSAASAMLRELTVDVPSADASNAPAAGEWAVVDVVRHLVEGDRDKFLPRLRRMLAEEPSRNAFARARAETLAFLRALPETAGERLGISGFFGPISVFQYATHIADHDIEHLRQIQGTRAATDRG